MVLLLSLVDNNSLEAIWDSQDLLKAIAFFVAAQSTAALALSSFLASLRVTRYVDHLPV
ncbi:hypothetical protein H6F50_06205 [Coleofasciculus sp. FACHB-712]|uniref:hypothetical protein n=1 Tax=Cyanophyceae TaxID=3028117 RepID=UPI001688115C|nr:MULTISPECIES: hypothetical protein [unclassified Coleofasciculus]MBD1941954.1 hypothetical protein [Coleofasciculus sp. FACHB-712]MBD2541349.1 hypothetical protein [Coleofasciculus sp. FACHB-SPT36]